MAPQHRLGVGFVGVPRDIAGVDVVGAWSPHPADVAGAAVKPYRSIAAMVADARIDALWICDTVEARVEQMDEITDAVIRAKGKLRAVACEAPLAATDEQARRMVELAAHAGVKHGYLEHRLFAADVERERARLWAECGAAGRPAGVQVTEARLDTAVLVMRLLLTRPGEALASVQAVRVSGNATTLRVEFETDDGRVVVGDGAVARPAHLVSGQRAMDAHVADAFVGRHDALATYEDGFDALRWVTAAGDPSAGDRGRIARHT